jgi:hypothetical protein
MPNLIEITAAQSFGWQGLAETLAASDIESVLVEMPPRLRLAVGTSSAREIAQVLETWLVERKSSLIPQVIDGEHIVLRPPAA